MKPRPPVAPLTNEDYLIAMRLCSARKDLLWYPLFYGSRHVDRRDAELMLGLRVGYSDVSAWKLRTSYSVRVWHAACAFQGIPIPADFRFSGVTA